MRTLRGYLKLSSLISLKSDVPQIKTFPAKGIYTLIIFLSRELSLNVGKLGVKQFPKGYYTYTGSAIGKGDSSLKSRISRHLRKEKRKHWHIDYLLAHQNAKITAVVAAQNKKRLECAVNCHLKEEGEAKIPVRGFGASDCKENCTSHLIFFPDITKDLILVEKIVKCYRHFSLPTRTLLIPRAHK